MKVGRGGQLYGDRQQLNFGSDHFVMYTDVEL